MVGMQRDLRTLARALLAARYGRDQNLSDSIARRQSVELCDLDNETSIMTRYTFAIFKKGADITSGRWQQDALLTTPRKRNLNIEAVYFEQNREGAVRLSWYHEGKCNGSIFVFDGQAPGTTDPPQDEKSFIPGWIQVNGYADSSRTRTRSLVFQIDFRDHLTMTSVREYCVAKEGGGDGGEQRITFEGENVDAIISCAIKMFRSAMNDCLNHVRSGKYTVDDALRQAVAAGRGDDEAGLAHKEDDDPSFGEIKGEMREAGAGVIKEGESAAQPTARIDPKLLAERAANTSGRFFEKAETLLKSNIAVASNQLPDAPPGSMRFVITRHAFSCNNLAQKVRKALRKTLNIFQMTHRTVTGSDLDVDPSLANGGISSARQIRIPASDEVTKVYVSCLIRTWQTSVLLYGKYKPALTVVVSPYLKEFIPMPASRRLEGYKTTQQMVRNAEHAVLTKGNTPIPIQSDERNGDDADARKEERCVGESQLSKMKCFLDLIHTYDEYSTLITLNIDVDEEIYSFQWEEEEDSTYNGGGHWRIRGGGREKKDYPSEWLQEGDVVKFLGWVRNKNHPSAETVHCISHSQVMQSFVRHFLPQLPPSFGEDFQEYKTKNCWSVFGYTDGQSGVSLSALKEGSSDQNEATDEGGEGGLCGYG